MYVYAIVLALSVAVPLIRSFETRHIHFIGKFRFLLPAMLLTSIVFIPWDVYFTHKGIWGFNNEYLLGLKLWGLPIEEVLFFFVIPFICLFSYEVLNYFIKQELPGKVVRSLNWGFLALLAVMAIVFRHETYTLWVAVFTFFLLALVGPGLKPLWMARFYLMFFVVLVPFILVNGVLTGAFFDKTVVWYNADAITGLRIITIPIEDVIYAFGLLLMNTAIYEYFRKRAGLSPWSES